MITLEELKRKGYCVTSRKHRCVSRIDRKDWKEILAEKNLPADADLYRRCYSKDNLVVSNAMLAKLKNSAHGYQEYRA